ncbi:WYL domain-containing protein [Streptomyces mobaraensis NBRC 13819 = DSM 40847]|uniref:Helix-turn-helix type 11 domain protein n=1 Tax=Streptomyces mobaraensis (strain ATCC 29032 / DSM 40847 / JCM 4168 / NBRC 13819 / NCIMB 11159 / IPCR 16-22) TaxID=1223523 RepID=M3C5B6_STRM1|nr:WYL domain-containing protein [Streptomyces mobaraensis]EME99165.1 helix-turn-helix type 11 domain protein [Streptomyces mobaraensis NBRC 13819 = DSM 40847]QTT72711.1 WYL domain-containing protein [Streptomyces mobaraensis NBRC 13819 = DSM 40847]
MRADRLLSLLLLLQNRGRMTAPELAAELEVSVRTVYRDVEALGASGVPVVADRGPTGGFRLVGGYRTRLTGLTEDEAGSLALATVPGAAAELGLGADLAAARLKLEAALPAGTGERARRVAERFHLDAPGWFRDAEPVPHLAVVADAVWRQRALRVHYRRWKGEVRRELHPLGLVLKGGVWYLVAEAEADIRTYRVSRFLAVEPLPGRFERPADFDLAAVWTETSSRLEGMRYQGEARLRVSPGVLRLLPAKFGAAGARAVAEAGSADADGWAEVMLPVESLPVAVCDLLGLGAEAEVLAPPELRAAVAAAATALAARYAAGG